MPANNTRALWLPLLLPPRERLSVLGCVAHEQTAGQMPGLAYGAVIRRALAG